MTILPSDLSFNNVRRIEFSLAGDLIRLQDIAHRVNQSELKNEVEKTIIRIQERSFSVAVVGVFKRGKSTFINALLGKEILPADIAPTSATLNRVTHGLQPRAQIIFKDKRIEEVPIDQITEYVTKLTPEAEAMAATVEEAVVSYPIPYLENNVHIYDTPGLNDDEAMTTVTLSVLSKVDTAIMVIMPTSPFSGFEGDFLNKLLMNDIGRVIFVVTAIDRIRPKDRERIMTMIRDRIEKAVVQHAKEQFEEDSDEYHHYLKQIGQPKLYAISGYDALHAKMDNDSDLLTESGFRELEAALEKFLSEERGAVTLKVISDRIIAFSEQLNKILSIEQGAMQMQQQEFDQTMTNILTELAALKQQSFKEMEILDSEADHITAQLHTQIQIMKENIFAIANSIVDEAKITPEDIRRATFGAMGGYVSNLANRVPENMQEQSKKGFGRFWNKMPNNIQKAGESAMRKVSENVQNVQEKNRSPVIEEMEHKILEAIQNESQKSATAMQQFMQNHLKVAVDRVRTFGKMADNLLKQSEEQFASPKNALVPSRSAVAGRLTASLSIITELGDLWSSDQLVGLKSGVGSGISSLNASFSLGWQNMKTRFSSDEDSATQEGIDPVIAYKDDRKEKIEAEIERQLNENQVENKLIEQMNNAFIGLKQKFSQELEQSIELIEARLDSFNQKREQTSLLNERANDDLKAMQKDIKIILDKAYQLSNQLLNF